MKKLVLIAKPKNLVSLYIITMFVEYSNYDVDRVEVKILEDQFKGKNCIINKNQIFVLVIFVDSN